MPIDWQLRHCRPQTGPALDRAEAERRLLEIPGWSLEANGRSIQRSFSFSDYYETIAFVNALAWIAHREDHHPDLSVSYNRCIVTYSTHSAGGLSENDLICAARINAIVDRHPGRD